ncbi:type III pantothenate kinase [Burkholderia sp. WSM2232]|uniref:type III pantothenate kinase n=1 Tax=Burkholderia sp. WSM2232 TaxID=944436 RepID=UPI0003F85F57|nr:type III pantothenate kinase [Burkholderia sp. WSM2232]
MTSGAPRLLIDAGNSRVKWAMVTADGAQLAAGALSHGESDSGEWAAETTAQWASLPAPCSAWLSNVAGDAAAARIAALVHAQWPGLPLTTIRARERQCGVTNSYTTPHALGSDRWAGMIGAHAAFPGEHLLIATFGTATTLEALRADGCFVGGLIAPGWSLMMRSLGEHTAQLPTLDANAARGLLGRSGSGGHAGLGGASRSGGSGRAAAMSETGGKDASGGTDGTQRAGATVGPLGMRRAPGTDDRPDPPPRGPFFATDTRRSLSAGCTLAQAGFVERTWRDLQDEWQVPVRLVVSGGAADEVAGALKVPHTRHDSLVLSGLALIASEQEQAANQGA